MKYRYNFDFFFTFGTCLLTKNFEFIIARKVKNALPGPKMAPKQFFKHIYTSNPTKKFPGQILLNKHQIWIYVVKLAATGVPSPNWL